MTEKVLSVQNMFKAIQKQMEFRIQNGNRDYDRNNQMFASLHLHLLTTNIPVGTEALVRQLLPAGGLHTFFNNNKRLY